MSAPGDVFEAMQAAGWSRDGAALIVERAFDERAKFARHLTRVFLNRKVPPVRESKTGGYKKQPIPAALRWAVFERDNFTCTECGARRFLHAHHIIPESKGGPTTLENLTTHCRDCNLRKGNRA